MSPLVVIGENGTISPEWIEGRFTEITGHQPNIGTAYSAADVHPDDRAQVEWDIHATVQGTPTISEYRLIRPDKRIVWLHVQRKPIYDAAAGRVTHMYITAQDVTARKETEAALKEREALLNALIEQSLDSIRIIDEEQRIVVWNPASEALTGLKRQEVVGKKFADVTVELIPTEARSPENDAYYRDSVRRALEMGADMPVKFARYEHQTQNTDGSIRYVETTLFPVEAGSRHYICGINRDITERKQVEIALRESEEKYRLIAENTSDGILIIDAVTSEVIYASPAFLQTWHREYSAESFPSYEIYKMAHPDDRDELFARTVETIAAKQPTLTYHYRVQADDGSSMWREDHATFIYDYSGRHVRTYIISRDITHRKQTEDALRQSEAQLRSLLETQTALIIKTDIQGRYTYVNPAYYERFRWMYDDLDAMIGSDSMITILPEDQPEAEAVVESCIQQPGKAFQVTLRKPTRDGSSFWSLWEFVALTDSQGNICEVQCVGLDITELIAGRVQLQLQESALRAAANAIVITDRDARIQWVNPAFSELTGYSFGEAQGENLNQLLHSGHHDPAFHTAMWKAIQAGNVWRGRMVSRRKDGSLFTEEQTLTPVYGESGTITHFVSIKQDITDREQNERLEMDYERLKVSFQKEQDQNALIQRIISMLSHDLRTTLSVMSFSRDMLVRYHEQLNTERRQEKLDIIGRQIQFALNLLDDTVQIARGKRDERDYNPQPVNLALLCQISIDEIRTTKEINQQLSFINLGDVQTVSVDEILVSRILLNLLSNAVKYSPNGGEIKLELDLVPNGVLLRVSDEGIGISPKDLPHIFEPLYRAEGTGSVSGSGLGLSIVRDCVDRHRGAIRVESVQGEGTTFTVTLPAEC